MLIMDLLFDLLRFEAVLRLLDFSVLGFFASKPASRSIEPSLGLFVKDSGGASLDIVDGLEPLVGILDIWEPSSSFSLENDGLNSLRNNLSVDDIRSSNVLCIKSGIEVKLLTFRVN